MHAEQLEVAAFLQKHPPFQDLPEEAVNEMAQQVEISYYREGRDILHFREQIDDLYLIRSGAVETFRRSGELYNRLGEGGIFGQLGLMMNHLVRFPVRALEDTLIYCIPATLFHDYCEKYDKFADYFEAEDNALLRQAITTHADNNDLITVKVKELVSRDLVTISMYASISEAAVRMTERGVSSLLITDPEQPLPMVNGNEHKVVGIITDRDLRIRALAESMSYGTPVSKVMTTDLITLDDNAYVFEAILAMLRHNVHHLPILHRQRCTGVLALSDVVRHESQSSILLVRGILSQNSVSELQHYAKQLPAVFVRMVNEDANSHMIGSAMSVIGRSFKQRLLTLAEEKLGPPPVPYCFLALGSMARDEQLIVTDQDNALILDNGFQPEQHSDYFEDLATFVSNGLAACGYSYCTGNIMATNPACRQTLDEWKRQFAQWIEHPIPQALLNSSIFFDLEGVWGEISLANELREFIANKAPANRAFLASLARNALNRTPPLGFFKDFVLEQDGEHKNSINLKRRGTAPLTDVIRVHALAVGSQSQNSFDRMEDVIGAKVLPPGKGQDLCDALEYISMVRVRHQSLAIQAGEKPGNNIQPDNLSSFERRNLKEAFQVLDSAQNFLKFRYTANTRLR